MSKQIIIVIICALIGFFPVESSAQDHEALDLYSHPFRPTLAKPQKKVSFSFTLIPNIGSTNFFEFKKSSSMISGLIPEGNAETQLEQMNEQLKILNSFQGMETSPDLIIIPSIHFGFNTKYLEFRLTGAAKSSNHAYLSGLANELQESDLNTDGSGNYFLDLGQAQTLFSAVSDNLMGGDTMLIGKIPVGPTKILIGSGAVVAYRYTQIYSLIAPAEMNVDNKISTSNEEFKDFIWGINGLIGLEYLDPNNNFNPRLVFEARKLYSNNLSDYKPEFNMGFMTKLGKAGYFAFDILKLKDPTIKMEYMKTFLGNNEIALGGIIRNQLGPEHMGYVALGLGGNFIKFNTLCFFTKESVGGMVGLSLGWQP